MKLIKNQDRVYLFDIDNDLSNIDSDEENILNARRGQKRKRFPSSSESEFCDVCT